MRYMNSMRVGAQVASRNGLPIPVETLARVIPSAFAEEAHESRSQRYAFIPTAAVIDGLAKEGFRPFWAVQQRVRDEGKRDYTRHVIRFRHDSSGANGDSLPELVLLNSHDGTSAYRLMSGLFRMVCANGLICGEMHSDIKVRHSGNVVGEVIEGAYTVLENSRHAIAARDEMARIELRPAEADIFAEAAAHLRWEDAAAAPVEPRALLTTRRHDDSGDDLWRTFNRVQENVIQGGLRGRTTTNRRTTTRQVTGVSENIRLNRALWTLAERMAQLKAA